MAAAHEPMSCIDCTEIQRRCLFRWAAFSNKLYSRTYLGRCMPIWYVAFHPLKNIWPKDYEEACLEKTYDLLHSNWLENICKKKFKFFSLSLLN